MLYSLAYYAAHKTIPYFSLLALHKKIFAKIFLHKSKRSLEKHVDIFLNRFFKKMLNPVAIKCLKEARNRGDKIIILSSSPCFLVQPIAKRLKAHECIATEYKTDERGNFLSIKSVVDGKNKAKNLQDAMRRFKILDKNTFAYSDSHLDIPFLSASAHAIAINPDKILEKTSKRKGWEILL